MHRAALAMVSAFCLVVLPRSAIAKAHFMGLDAAVAASDAVALVQIESSEKVDERAEKPKKGDWTYGQKNVFRLVEFIKRAPFVDPAPKTPQVLWAEKDFICASESFRPGSYLVFLESVEPNEWIPVNHDMGGLRVEKNVVIWPIRRGNRQ